MERCFKHIINLLLALVAFQVFNLNTAECAASANDGSITADHTLTYLAKRYWDHTFDRQHHSPATHGHDSHDSHHKARAWKKFYPSGYSITADPARLALVPANAPLQHFATANGYAFQYFRPINPPPPKVIV